MSQELQTTQDLMGRLSQTDLNAQDIQNIIDAFNKFQDQYTSGNISQGQQSITVFDTKTNRVLIGYQTVLQQWGLFVSKPGIDVTQATADQLILNSNQDMFKIVKTDTMTLTKPAGSNFAEGLYAHGLSYQPGIIAYSLIVNSYSGMPFLQFNAAGNNIEQTSIAVDNFYIYLDISTPNIAGNVLYTSAVTRTVRFYLLQETAN